MDKMLFFYFEEEKKSGLQLTFLNAQLLHGAKDYILRPSVFDNCEPFSLLHNCAFIFRSLGIFCERLQQASKHQKISQGKYRFMVDAHILCTCLHVEMKGHISCFQRVVLVCNQAGFCQIVKLVALTA